MRCVPGQVVFQKVLLHRLSLQRRTVRCGAHPQASHHEGNAHACAPGSCAILAPPVEGGFSLWERGLRSEEPQPAQEIGGPPMVHGGQHGKGTSPTGDTRDATPTGPRKEVGPPQSSLGACRAVVKLQLIGPRSSNTGTHHGGRRGTCSSAAVSREVLHACSGIWWTRKYGSFGRGADKRCSRRRPIRDFCSISGPGGGPIMGRTVRSITDRLWKVIGIG